MALDFGMPEDSTDAPTHPRPGIAYEPQLKPLLSQSLLDRLIGEVVSDASRPVRELSIPLPASNVLLENALGPAVWQPTEQTAASRQNRKIETCRIANP